MRSGPGAVKAGVAALVATLDDARLSLQNEQRPAGPALGPVAFSSRVLGARRSGGAPRA
ncbi:MAG TPA: hypothetical protein VF832_04185 [Longimicrobiales bacterium]